MSRVHAEAAAVIPAPPDMIYALLVDYVAGHPQILPPQYFRDLQVESGGRGAGTVIRLQAGAMGRMRPMRMLVAEPEPGRVLSESDTASSLVTTFTVTPVAGGTQAQVRIATHWDAAAGLAGMLERLLIPSIYRRIYRAELAQLAAVLGAGNVV
ncbi:MAG: SRPBCC family protein [Chloroflexota bacterium]|nr:SRPBCC family protein [Chloroflexota bacterium]